jgi:putative ABC transport system permease protein
MMLGTTEYIFTLASLYYVVEGVSFGILICIVCAVYPAWQAANLSPIDALRHE